MCHCLLLTSWLFWLCWHWMVDSAVNVCIYLCVLLAWLSPLYICVWMVLGHFGLKCLLNAIKPNGEIVKRNCLAIIKNLCIVIPCVWWSSYYCCYGEIQLDTDMKYTGDRWHHPYFTTINGPKHKCLFCNRSLGRSVQNINCGSHVQCQK